MKNFAVLLLVGSLCAFSAGNAEARGKKFTKTEIFSLAKKVKAKRASLQKALRTSSIPLVRFYSSPAAPKTGEEVTLFLQMDTSFTDNETIVLGALNSVSKELEHPATELWVADLGAFSEIRSHEFKASVYIQNASDAQQIRNAITQLEGEIATLNQQIEDATDPAIIEQLTALRDDKVSQKNVLIQALSDLKSPVGEEVFTFSVAENTESADYPHISGVQPNVAKLNTAREITISGANFGASPSVSIGGRALAVSSSNATSIVGMAPGFAAQGVKDIEVRFASGDQVKNAFLKNAFFVTSEDTGTPPEPTNYPPVAVASASAGIVDFGQPAAFVSTGSYDPENQALRYEWRLISKPTGSSIEVPTNPPGTEAAFSVNPDVAGYYVAELRVFEQAGAQLASFPSLAIVQVNAPVNHAPLASAAPMGATSGATVTNQVEATDQDVGQILSFAISTPPTKGFASVSSSGLITYTAGLGTSGADVIGVTVSDNGTPQMSTTIQVEVSIVLNQAPIVPSPLFYTLRSEGVPYQVALSLSGNALPTGGIVDPDGSIQSVKWSFGDGTEERATDFSQGAIFHNYVATGNFTATLTATDNLGLSTSQQIVVVVVDTDMPTAKFTVSPSNGGGGTLPLTVTFDASGSSDTDGITQYRWRWGNVNTDEVTTNPIITHTFTQAGTYSVRLRTRDMHAAQGESVVNVVAGSTTTGSPIQAQFKVGPPRQVLFGTAHTFDGSGSFNPNVGGTVASYAWNFGDFTTCPGASGGCVGSGVNTSYTYPGLGNLRPSLRVQSGGGGLSQLVFQDIYVVNAGNAPKAMFRATPGGPLTVNFDGTESYDYEGALQDYLWIFGDGNTATGPVVSHTYASAGPYSARLIVTDSDGNPNNLTQMVSASATRSDEKTLTSSSDPERENQRQILAGACFDGSGEACFMLAAMYEEDGDSATAQYLTTKACELGHQPACER